MNKRVVKIMSGISGSGKSTYAEDLLNQSQGVKVSADHFFMQNGKYLFDPSKLGEAHADCFARFIKFCQDPNGSMIVVDNTSCSSEEIAPYVLGAQAFGWEPEIITLFCNADQVLACAKRNQHNVPHGIIEGQHRRLVMRHLPSFWKHRIVPVKF
jgi:predicted kinase